MQRFSVLNQLCVAEETAARIEPALALARQIVEIADGQDDPTFRLVGNRLLAQILYPMGRNREALESLLQVEQYRDPSRDRQLSYRFGFDLGLAVLCWKIFALQSLGLCNQAARVIEEVKAEGADHGNSNTVAMCNLFAVIIPETWSGDFEAIQGRCEMALDIK